MAANPCSRPPPRLWAGALLAADAVYGSLHVKLSDIRDNSEKWQQPQWLLLHNGKGAELEVQVGRMLCPSAACARVLRDPVRLACRPR